MVRYLCLAILLFPSLQASVLGAEPMLRLIAWNLEGNGQARRSYVTEVLEEKDGVQLWGLSEVNPARADAFVEAIGSDEPGSFMSQLGTTGGRIRLQMIWDTEKLELIGSTELKQEFGALADINRQRAPLVGHFKGKQTGQEFLFVVCHLQRGDSRLRHKQAKALSEWAGEQELPVIIVGDMNIDFDVFTGDQGQRDLGYDNLVEEGHLVWVRPLSLVKTQSSRRFTTVLDFVFVGNPPRGWTGESKILAREGDQTATELGFRDTNITVDHRPVDATFVLRRGVSDELDAGLMRDDFSGDEQSREEEPQEEVTNDALAEILERLEALEKAIQRLSSGQ